MISKKEEKMKEKYILDLIPGEDITEFFLVKRIEIKTGSNGKRYLDLLLSDKTGEISGKKWDVDAAEESLYSDIEVGEVIKIRGSVTEWNGISQLRVARIRTLTNDDEIDIVDFVMAAPESPEEMFEYIYSKASVLADEELKKVAITLLERNKERLLYYPAAKSNHHAVFGGLLYHIKRMLMLAEHSCEVYTFLNKDLLLTGVIIHDIEKLNEMDADESGVVSEYTFEGQLLGHLIMGVRTIDRLSAELNISNEKAVMLEHMMLSHHYEADFGSPKKPMFPEAEALHYMDMIDSKMYDFEANLEGVKPGNFSEWIRTLDGRRLYKKNDSKA